MKIKPFILLTLMTCYFSVAKAQLVTVSDSDKARAKAIVSQMTLSEKLMYISGYHDFYIRSIPRLGVPEIRMADGPQGVRNDTKSTMYPAGILSAATWNKDLVRRLGASIGMDAKARGVSIMLGPGVNIYRAPMCGRNFEYFGEDPYLASEVAKEYVIGMQSQGVISTIKHFAMNNQEWDRHHTSSDADERTIQEIYFATFRKAVEQAHVGAVMNSYNLLNGVHASENRWMNIDVLRNQWGFQGILMSDWGSVYSGVAAANGGLDLEMPDGAYMNEKNLLPAIQNGLVSEATIDLKVQHILQTLIAFGMLDRELIDKSIPKDNPVTRQTALDLAREGVVLLKNDAHILPLQGATAFIGPNANRIPTGGGSGFVDPYSTATVWQGMQDVYKKKDLKLVEDAMWVREMKEGIAPFKAEYFANQKLEGAPAVVQTENEIDHDWKDKAPLEGLPADHFSARWTSTYKPQKNGLLKLQMQGDDGYRLYVNDQLLLEDWGDHGLTSRDALLKVEAGKEYAFRIEHYDNAMDAAIRFHASALDEGLLKSYLSKAKNIVLCLGFDSMTESEGFDRTFALPQWQELLIDEIASFHNNVVVVVNAGGGIKFKPWIDKVKAVVMAWYPGQEGGKAIAEILTGKLSPSGKLPISIEEKWEDNPVYNSYYDKRDVTHRRVLYSEGVFTGYRGYDKSGKKPLFPFGFGLSYTTFSYSNLSLEKSGENKVKVSFDVKNTGKVDGSEVAQIYVHDVQASVPQPLKELKGYEKVYLKHGETKRVTVELDEEAFSFYDVNKHGFVVEPGDFDIMVGSSSAELPLHKVITL